MDYEEIFICNLCDKEISKYLKSIHEVKCRIEQSNKKLEKHTEEIINKNDDDGEISIVCKKKEYGIDLNETEPNGDDFMLSIMEKIKSRREALQISMNRFEMENRESEDKAERVNYKPNEKGQQVRHEEEFKKGDIIHNEELIHNEEIDYSITNTDNDTLTIMNTNKECSLNETNGELNNTNLNKQVDSQFEEKEIYEETSKALLDNENEVKEINLEGNINLNEKEDEYIKLDDSKVFDSNKLFSNEKIEILVEEKLKHNVEINKEINKEKDQEKENEINVNKEINKEKVDDGPETVSSKAKIPLDVSQLSNKIPKKSYPNNNHTNNPTVKYTPNPIFIDTELLQKIELTELEKEKELQHVLEEIQTIESSLSIDERLMHEKWQIRKNAYKKVSEIISSCERESSTSPRPEQNASFYDKSQIFETFSPWLKYFISETNLTALFEGLNTFFTFVNYAIDYRSKAMLEFFDELEKILNHSKQNINEICTKIINLFLNTKKLLNSTFNELLKKLNINNSSNSKLLNFIQKLLLDLIVTGQFLNETYIKLILEKSILYYSSSLTSKSLERKKIFAKLISEVYSYIEDDFEVIKRNINVTNTKDLEKVISTVKKKTLLKKYVLYSDTLHTLQMSKGNNGENINSNSDSPDELNNKNNVKHSENKHPIKETPTEVNDILSIIPDEFLGIAYITQFNKKKEILEKTNKILSHVVLIKDREKDHREILSNLNYAIDDSNVLVHSEGIKCLNHIARLLKMNINTSKLKLLLISCFDKFKDKKSLVKIELYYLFDSLIKNSCFTLENLVSFTIQFILTGKNPVIKQSLLEYLKSLFTEKDSLLTRSVDLNSYVSFAKILAESMLTETHSGIKDLSTDLIMVFKMRAGKEAEGKFEKIVDGLTSYRKNIIANGKNNCGEVTEKEYKSNLRRIKSNLSFNRVNTSTSKDSVRDNRFDTGGNVNNQKEQSLYSKNINLKRNQSEKNVKINSIRNKENEKEKEKEKERTLSKNKNTLLFNKNQTNSDPENKKDSASNYNTNALSKPMQTRKELLDKMMNKKKKNIDDNSINDKGNNIKKSKDDNNIKRITHNNNNNEKNENSYIKIEEKRKNIPSIETENNNSLLNSQRSHGTNISVLENRMESAIEHIYSLSNSGLIEYTKKVIKDFLIFVKNVTSKKLNEDMESHFQVIIRILSKIWERIKAVHDELIIQTLKVIIVTPCFIDVAENGLGKIYRHFLFPFMEILRSRINNDEKVFYYYLDILNKFINYETKGTTFLENINPRPTILMFLAYFVNQENDNENENAFDIEKMNVIENIVEVIEKSPFLSEYEKAQYFKVLNYNNNDHDQDKENKDEEINFEDTNRDHNHNHNPNPDPNDESQSDNYNKLESSLIENIKSAREEEGIIFSNIINYDNESSPINNTYNDNEMAMTERSELNEHGEESSRVNSKWREKFKETENILQRQIEENEKLKEKLNTLSITPSVGNNLTNLQSNNFERNEVLENAERSKINIHEDIADIKDKIKQKVRKLDMTIQRLGNKIEKREEVVINQGYTNTNTYSSNKKILNDSIANDISILNSHNNNNNSNLSNNNKVIRSLQDFYDEEKHTNHKYPNNSHNDTYIDETNITQFNQLSNKNNFNSYNSNPLLLNKKLLQDDPIDIKNLILKIPSNLLDDNVCEIALYVKLESLFQKANFENKQNFSSDLKQVLESTQLIKASSFNCFLQLFEFLLKLLTHVLKNIY